MHPDDQELLLDSLDACEEYTAQTLELESGIRAELESLTLDELFALLGQTEEDWSAALERRQNIAMRNILRLIVYNRQSGMTNITTAATVLNSSLPTTHIRHCLSIATPRVFRIAYGDPFFLVGVPRLLDSETATTILAHNVAAGLRDFESLSAVYCEWGGPDDYKFWKFQLQAQDDGLLVVLDSREGIAQDEIEWLMEVNHHMTGDDGDDDEDDGGFDDEDDRDRDWFSELMAHWLEEYGMGPEHGCTY